MVRLTRCAIPVLTFVGLALGISIPGNAAQHKSFTPVQKDAIEEIVRDYILNNPEVIVEGLQKLERRRKLSEAQRSRAQLQARKQDILNDPGSPVGGNPKGDVTVVEFFDYRCPYCRAVAPKLAKLKKDDRGIRFVYKEWPILGPDSEVAARAALAAHKQARYEDLHKALMSYRGKLKSVDVFKLADGLGLNMSRLRRDMRSKDIGSAIARTRELASALGIRGTPAFVIGDVLLPGAVSMSQLKSLVKKARDGN